MQKPKSLVRIIERPHIINARREELKSAFTGEDALFELTPLEFLLITGLYQLNVTFLLLQLDLTVKYGPVTVCIAYAFLTVLLGMPLFMLFTFMSSYSKTSFLKFWECVPLFKGLGYSLAVVRLCFDANNAAISAFVLLLLLNYFNGHMEKGFRTCSYNVTKECVGMFPSQPLKKRCANSSSYVLTASQSFIRYVEHNFSRVKFLNVDWFAFICIVWVLIFFSSIYGMRNVRKITVCIQLFSSIVLIMVGFFILSLIPWSTISVRTFLETNKPESFLNFNFWVDMILHAGEVNVLANTLWMGTIKPKSLQPKHAAVIISPMKTIVFVVIKCLFLCLVKENIVHYKYQDYNCFKYNGRDLLFTLIPDVLFRTNIYNLFIPLWYTCLFLYSFCAPLYSVMSMADALLQVYRSLCKYKIYVHLVICVLCFLVTGFIVTRTGNNIVHVWSKCSMPVMTSLLFLVINLAILFIYSTSEIIEDHMFTYAMPPEKYWITLWKMAPLFAIFAFILVTHNHHADTHCAKTDFLIIISHLSSSLTFLPLVVVFITTCFLRIKEGEVYSLSNPSSEWGPHDPKKRTEKKLFFPQRDIKYRNNSLRCQHKCITEKYWDFSELLEKHKKKLEELENEYLTHNQDNNLIRGRQVSLL